MAIKKPGAADKGKTVAAPAAEVAETPAAEVAAEVAVEVAAAEVAAEVAAPAAEVAAPAAEVAEAPETETPLSMTAGQAEATPTLSSTFDPEEGVSVGEEGLFALQTPYTLVNHLTGTRFTQHSETKHVKDYWIVNQMTAKLIVEIISES